MWNKIKTVLAVIGACICSVCVALFLKSRSDRRGSEGNDERDKRIKEGINRTEGNIEESYRIAGELSGTIQEGIDQTEGNIEEADRIAGELSGTIEERTRDCEEQLSRAEEIIRGAIKRGEK